jgi:hypothetical protein
MSGTERIKGLEHQRSVGPVALARVAELGEVLHVILGGQINQLSRVQYVYRDRFL